MTKLCVVLGDQLSLNSSSLQNINADTDYVLMAEVNSEATYVKHHKAKIAFVFSAMRHFANEIKQIGYCINYVKYNDTNNKGSLTSQVADFLANHQEISSIVVMKPAEYRLHQDILTWSHNLQISVEITEDNRFMLSETFFSSWAKGRKQLRMEYFYREARKLTGYLMEANQPVGGKWNYDTSNRQKLPKHAIVPPNTQFTPDDITKEVMALVKKEFHDHFGELKHFHYAVTREQALLVLAEFIEQRLPNFGAYQDAMAQNEPWLYHSHIALYLNIGLLHPKEVLDAAQEALEQERSPINSVEGFIRQILGWREYVRGLYWLKMPEYKQGNYLNATKPLPDFYWTADTDMNCISQCVSQTKDFAYAHHIQRLMVLGNFAVLTGLSVDEVNEWYLLVYADAYEWVELPNVSGMVLFADGGKLASKPYVSSGSYIHKMSNYCSHCHYNVKAKTGHDACPFNYLYWHFLIRHKDKFANNPRMAMMYRTMAKMDESQLNEMYEQAEIFLKDLS